jgi:hypothetical protein
MLIRQAKLHNQLSNKYIFTGQTSLWACSPEVGLITSVFICKCLVVIKQIPFCITTLIMSASVY